MKTKPKINELYPCHKCGRRAGFRFRDEWWCNFCLDKHENVDSKEYLEHQRFYAYAGSPGGGAIMPESGHVRLTADEKRKMVGV